MLIECQECGGAVSENSPSCGQCGAPPNVYLGPLIHCAECGADFRPGHSACRSCGATRAVAMAQPGETAPSVSVAATPIGQSHQRWSIWKAALFGCLPSAYLVMSHFIRGVEPHPSQTTAGQVAYWFGYAGIWPALFVVAALIRNVFVSYIGNGKRGPRHFMNFFWPTNIKPSPSGIARLGRVVHWLFAMGAVAFAIGSVFAFFGSAGVVTALLLLFVGGGACLLVGRALRYILAGE